MPKTARDPSKRLANSNVSRYLVWKVVVMFPNACNTLSKSKLCRLAPVGGGHARLRFGAGIGSHARGILAAIALMMVAVAPLYGSEADEDNREEGAQVVGLEPLSERSPKSDEDSYYFYRGLNYGSEAMLHPIRLIINGGYGILQIDHRTNRLTDVDYETGWRNVWRNISNPFEAIRVNGWSDFLSREVIPISVNGHDSHYWPNYTLHLIGGGMSYRLYAEWFRYHHYRRPKILSALTIAVYHVLNEVVENNDYVGWTTDPIADLLLFDPLGILLFTSDRVCRFFGQTLNMADWSYQPSINMHTGELENHGQNFAMKLNIPRVKRWQLFYHFGTHGELGLTRRITEYNNISVAFGLKANELFNSTDGIKAVNLAYAGGIFYDRNNSLLASVLFARTKDYRVRVNFYPGLFRIGPLAPGFFVADRRDSGLVFGITYIYQPGLPVGIATSAN